MLKSHSKFLFIFTLLLFISLLAACSETTTGTTPTNEAVEVTDEGSKDDVALKDQTAIPVEDSDEPLDETDTPTEEDVPTEFQSALKQAESYSNTLHLSKAGIYDQLTSEYGGQFPAEAAQYAIDNVNADWNANALKSAESYQQTLNLSTEAIRDQLTSEFGGQFTAEEAEYAISNLK